MRFKNIKRLTSVLISLLLVAVITLSAAATTAILNGTDAENAATPKYYSAVKDWSGVNNTADSDNVFSYQFALDGSNPLWDYMSHKQWDYWYAGNTDYTNFADITEEEWSENYKADSFKHATGIGPKGYMRIWNRYGDLDLLESIPATALSYTAKQDGYIQISAHTVSLFSTYFTKNCGYRALIRITKNGENIYPQSGYSVIDETTVSVDIEELDFTVSKGDIVRFELTSDTPIAKTHGVGVNWNPLFYVTTEKQLYTKTSDIFNGLTGFMNSVFSSAESENMDITDSETLALEAAKRSKYGVYTALDSVYADGVIASDENSVWKYAVLTVPSGFEIPDTDYGIESENTESGLQIKWNNTNSVKAALVLTDGKYYTYMVHKGAESLQLPTISGDTIIQLSGENSASEIIRVTEESTETLASVDNSVIYLDSVVNTESGANSVYTLSNEKVNSSYSVRYSYSSFKSSATAEKGRTILFNAAEYEQMYFGFTAPQSGIYEISAPIEAKRDIKYNIFKQDTSGKSVLVDGVRSYNPDKTGYAVLQDMKAGETLWLNAITGADTQISIGIPRVTVKEEFADTEGYALYKYCALDYIENNYYNNKVYTTGSATEKSGRVWEFGSFENPIDSSGNNDTLGYMNYAVNDDVASLISRLSPYEIIRSGSVYNPLAMTLDVNGNVSGTYSFGAVGTLHPTMATAYTAGGAHREIGLPYQNKGFMVAVGLGEGKDGNTHNMGIYMKFTTPQSGNVTLSLSDSAQARTACHVLLIKDSKVQGIYSNIEKGTVAELGFMNKGESVYICYGTDSGKVYNYGGCPVAAVSGEKFFVSIYDSAKYYLTNGEKLKLPVFSDKIGKAILGWTDEESNFYDAGFEYETYKNTELYISDCYYGDITADAIIDALDLVEMRKAVLELKDMDLSISDVNSDSSFDVRDLVRMKRWLAGSDIEFNVK
ncbi:MAG: hypothetical protein IKB45_01265 [Clostridia bacterium]|nr:hypothetical protein [Clostridia bacterium]